MGRYDIDAGADPRMKDFKPTNPKDRIATNRLDLSLFPDTAVAYGALAMVEGDSKYGGYNYRIGGVLASVYYAAARRHLAKWFNGEFSDKKTGVPHLGSALACMAILIDAVECNVICDDRPPHMDLNKLLTKFEAKVSALHKMFPNGPLRYTEIRHGKKQNTKQKMTESIATPKKRKPKRHSSKRRQK